jgi:hypothetical protein
VTGLGGVADALRSWVAVSAIGGIIAAFVWSATATVVFTQADTLAYRRLAVPTLVALRVGPYVLCGASFQAAQAIDS